ncbi:MAG: hypothetical protein HY914_09460 [Desulfomonile tiedjei]|nr:hypothetical protein [Desulfomonile tiedjei]
MILISYAARFCFALAVILGGLALAGPGSAAGKELSDAAIAAEIVKGSNKTIIEEFIKQELRDVNEHVTKPLLPQRPSLIFFIKQVDKGPLDSLLFLEKQVDRLRDAQKNINSLLYSLAFSSGEKKKVLSLKSVADRIVSYGIPLMKRDFYRVLQSVKQLADKRRKNPMELLPDPAFRDAVYRNLEPTASGLDREMGELSEGELICMRLGFTLEEVTLTRLWLVFNDNKLPKSDDYMVFRAKRSEYFAKRLKKIYGSEGQGKASTGRRRR